MTTNKSSNELDDILGYFGWAVGEDGEPRLLTGDEYAEFIDTASRTHDGGSKYYRMNTQLHIINEAISAISSEIKSGARVYKNYDYVVFEGFGAASAIISDMFAAHTENGVMVAYPVDEIEWMIIDRLVRATEANKSRTPGEIIKDARMRLDLSAYRLAEKVGCTAQNLYQIESGKSSPSVELAKALGDALGIDWASLV